MTFSFSTNKDFMVSIFYTESVTQLNEGLKGKKYFLLNENGCFYVNTVIFKSVHIHSSMCACVGLLSLCAMFVHI